ncbi:MAG: lipopolysaccharide biosynthesis protein [Chryseobacterium sp.]|nr:lipopolysaccharide biosynthesis protein [Chryseobacterium sp.]
MIGNQLRNKKILYLSARTFNLEKQIKFKLESLGAFVTFYDERIKDSTLSKAVIRINKNIFKSKILRYYKSILNQTQHQEFDFMLVIRGEVVPEFFLKKFKEQHPQCVLIFYNWDSFTNTPNTSNFIHLYDRAFTFDPDDARNFNLHFRPLYYIDEYKNIKQNKEAFYDLLFLGTAHSDRYIISNKIKEELAKHGRYMFCYYFMHNKWVYYFKKIFDKTFKYFDVKKISFKSLSVEEILDLYTNSKVILDINHPNQKGLTLRTFESIGAQRKLITTNKEILKFDFYNPDNIYVLDRENCKIDIGFLDLPYQNINEISYNKLSIEGWIYNLFIDAESQYWSKFI